MPQEPLLSHGRLGDCMKTPQGSLVDGNHPNFILLSTVALRMDCGRGKRHNSEISVAVDVYVHTFYICRDISVNLCIYIYIYIYMYMLTRPPPPK